MEEEGCRQRSAALHQLPRTPSCCGLTQRGSLGCVHILLAWGPSPGSCLSLCSLPPLTHPFAHTRSILLLAGLEAGGELSPSCHGGRGE